MEIRDEFNFSSSSIEVEAEDVSFLRTKRSLKLFFDLSLSNRDLRASQEGEPRIRRLIPGFQVSTRGKETAGHKKKID